MLPLETGYRSQIPWILDNLSWVLTVPWTQAASLSLSSLYITTHDSKNVLLLSFRFSILFPILVTVTVLVTPLAVVGYLLRLFLSLVTSRQPFLYSNYSISTKEPTPCPSSVTFLTANVILAPEIFVRYNNNRNLYWRMQEIPRRLLKQNPKLNSNSNLQVDQVNRDEVIIDEIPNVDVIVLQEVFERLQGRLLANKLKDKYPYSIYDVTRHKFSDNACFMSSGLFLCSRFPILEADYQPFEFKTSYGKYMSYGVLIAKLYLGTAVINGKYTERVGYVSNLHTQAYEGKDKVIMSQLQQACVIIRSFIHKTWNMEKEALMFSVFGGDFNADNMSPCDFDVQNCGLWDEYEDVCMSKPGKDQTWAIGTEFRQPLIHLPEVQDPQLFRRILMDDVQRRTYILDADVVEQNLELTVVLAKPEKNGKIADKPWGGQRRIDKILLTKACIDNNNQADLLDKENKNGTKNQPIEKTKSVSNSTLSKSRNNCFLMKVKPVSAWFTSALAGLSDHIPFILEVELNSSDK